jgi:hypothetical protein
MTAKKNAKRSHSPQKQAATGKKALLVRFPSEMLERMDKAAARLGLNRSAFIVSSTAEKLERMEA